MSETTSVCAGVATVALLLMGATAGGDMPVAPGAIISDGQYDGFESSIHIHPSEGFQPCLVLRNDDDELHAFLGSKAKWEVSVVMVMKGQRSPVNGIGIGARLAQLREALPEGKLMRVDSELTDPVVFRSRLGARTLDVTVEWEDSFRRAGGNWETFSPKNIPESAQILSMMWY